MTVAERFKAVQTSAVEGTIFIFLTDTASPALCQYPRLVGDAIQGKTLCCANKLVRITATTDVTSHKLARVWMWLNVLDTLSAALTSS